MISFRLLGMTGAGKSKFISAAIGENAVDSNGPEVGLGMTSCTMDVQAFVAANPNKKGVFVRLVDTPGFDNSDGSRDNEQLKKIIKWLEAEPTTEINGILYLHDIQHWHFIRNLLMQPQDISWPPGASVVTTNWPSPVPEQFQSSEEDFRKHLRSNASSDTKEKAIPRFDYTTTSAWEILTTNFSSPTKVVTTKELAKKLKRICTDFDQQQPSKGRRLISGVFSRLFHH
ncbi:hypothetical protein BJ912DRAFT_1002114 [Pholiota molesta]|nr:hypothetical protein BJ912DRAFT_1002114 [Pholiota molesta]